MKLLVQCYSRSDYIKFIDVFLKDHHPDFALMIKLIPHNREDISRKQKFKKDFRLAKRKRKLTELLRNKLVNFIIRLMSNERRLKSKRTITEIGPSILSLLEERELADISAGEYDVLIVLGGGVIDQLTLSKFKTAINIHGGILPDYAGSKSIEWALLNKSYDKIGYTIHRMTEKMDQGAIVKYIWPEVGTYSLEKIKTHLQELAIRWLLEELNNKQQEFEMSYSKRVVPESIRKVNTYYGFEFNILKEIECRKKEIQVKRNGTICVME